MFKYLANQLTCFILCFLFVQNSVGQDAAVLPASLQSMGGVGVSLPWSEALSVNPAAASKSNLVLGISYQNRFLLKELSSRSATLILPFSASRFSLSFGQFGSDAFKENHLGIGLAKSFGEHFSGGIQFHYFQLRMAESEREPGLLTFSLGLRYENKGFGMGISCFNPLANKMTSKDFKRDYPLAVRVGVHKAFGNELLMASGVSYDESQNLSAHVGLQYFLLDRFCIRTGLQTMSPDWSFGLGFLFDKLQADFAFSYHEYLGFSPSVSLYFKQP